MAVIEIENLAKSYPFWKGINSKVKGRRAWTKDKIPTVYELRSRLTHQDAIGKAIILMLSSSGMRTGELIQIKESSINFASEPVSIYITGMNTKTGEGRTIFISSEAVEALNEWLKIRKGSIEGMHRKGVPRSIQKMKPDDKNIPNDHWQSGVYLELFIGEGRITQKTKPNPQCAYIRIYAFLEYKIVHLR